jgi:hypothetical protein
MALLGDTPLLPLFFRGLVSSRLGFLNENLTSATEAHLQALFGEPERRVYVFNPARRKLPAAQSMKIQVHKLCDFCVHLQRKLQRVMVNWSALPRRPTCSIRSPFCK